MSIELKSEPVETQISKFIEGKFNKSREEAAAMTIQSKMSLINMRYPEKWDEFKLVLRKAGYII